MVQEIAKRLNLTTLKFAKLETLVESIGLPKDRVCTHCFDGSSYDPSDAYREDHPEEFREEA